MLTDISGECVDPTKAKKMKNLQVEAILVIQPSPDRLQAYYSMQSVLHTVFVIETRKSSIIHRMVHHELIMANLHSKLDPKEPRILAADDAEFFLIFRDT